MSLSHSPSIVTNGLVFAYDMGNTKKSWKGAPTTNLISNPNNLSNGRVAPASCGSSFTDFTTGGPTNGPYVRVTRVTTSGITSDWPWDISYPSIAVGTTFKFSCYARSINGTVSTINFRNPDAEAVSFTLTPEWQRFSTTFTSGVQGGLQFMRINRSNTNDKTIGSIYDVADAQIEVSSVVTPFVNGTRSNTQALVDLTGNNTITASSLTYASDGTFSFTQPSSNFISVPLNNQFLSTGFTVNVWMNYSNVGGNDNVISWGLNAFNNTSYAWEIRIRGNANANVEFSPGVGPGGTGTPLRLQYNQGSTPLNGRTSLITVTFVANGVATFYENGIFKASTDYTGIGTYSTTNTLYIGRGTDSFFSGKIYATQIYNRALSAAEVKQNFNALRGRYGI